LCAPQWLAGLHGMILSPVFMDSPCIMPPSDIAGLTPGIFKKVMRMNQVDGIKCPPHTIVQLYSDPEVRVLLKSLQFIMYLGAALDRAVGDDLCEHARLTPLIGSTETGDQLSIRPANRKLWYTHDFVPENGSRMVRIPQSGTACDGSDDLYELILERPKNSGTSIFQPAFWNPAFDGLSRIETKEMYAPITDVDGRTRWVFSARKDDLTKLNWLAKFHAQDIEARIQQHTAVQSVCVGGEGRPTPYVIVEAREGVLDNKRKEQLLEELYANAVVRTNEADIDEIRIPKETVLLAKKEKPLRRNLKQVLLRKQIEVDYLVEIEEAYARLEKQTARATS
jgi:acyl-coenzyme A synthetase/AMP-(fatty) acid ligase